MCVCQQHKTFANILKESFVFTLILICLFLQLQHIHTIMNIIILWSTVKKSQKFKRCVQKIACEGWMLWGENNTCKVWWPEPVKGKKRKWISSAPNRPIVLGHKWHYVNSRFFKPMNSIYTHKPYQADLQLIIWESHKDSFQEAKILSGNLWS